MNPAAAPLYPPKATPTPEPQGVAVPAPGVPSTGTPSSEPMRAQSSAPHLTALQNPPRAIATPAASASTQPHSATPTSSAQAPNPAKAELKSAPRPVMSAKAAINAMYTAEKNNSNAKLIPSAREAVNAASRLSPKNFKSASNLHHGSLQKVQKVQSAPRSMESTRTSASALLKTVGSSSRDVPVVHTSLKLGANARPKDEPVVLPAGSRMAQAAKVITSGRQKIASVSRPRRIVRDPQMLSGGRRVLPSNPSAVLPAGAMNGVPAGAKAPSRLQASAPLALQAQTPNLPAHSAQGITVQNVAIQGQGTVSRVNRAQAPRSMDMTPARKLVRPRRFRTAPKNYAEATPAVVLDDNSYAMSEPPKLAVRRRSDAKTEDLGVVKNYHPSKLPEPIGDAAPIGRLAEQRVASGHGGPARPEPTIKAENTSNYSFSKRESKPKTSSYASADKSPFLKSVTVEKRPLSDSSVPTPLSLPRTAEAKPEKTSRKNSYQKQPDIKAELPTRPTVIVPSSRRSKAPLFFLILFTIILGAAVGAAVYLCFFQ